MRPAIATPPMTGGGLCACLMPGWSGQMWESQADGVRVLQRSMSTRAESSASIEESELTAAIWIGCRQGLQLSCRLGACAVP